MIFFCDFKFIGFCLLLIGTSINAANQYENNIIFRVFQPDWIQFNSTFDDNATLLANCNPMENYTIIVHGWGESIRSVWPLTLIGQFLDMRSGCVIFMDYFFYSKLGYATLVSHFKGIQAVLTRKLRQLDELGFDANNGVMFGFSFGSHLAFEGGYQFGPRKLARIDACDPAGPSFPASAISVKHAKDSAQNVQCIHTSSDKGTTLRYCQKSINMGRCGITQIGATSPPLMSHGLCPIFYRNAFTSDFNLVPKKLIETTFKVTCYNKTISPNVTLLSPTRMGIRLDTTIPDGEYYSITGKLSPFNLI